MAAFADASIAGSAFPFPLPVDEHVDGIAFDHNTIDGEIQRDLLETFEVLGHFHLQTLELIERQHDALNVGQIFLDVRSAKAFDRGIDPLKSGMILRIARIL